MLVESKSVWYWRRVNEALNARGQTDATNAELNAVVGSGLTAEGMAETIIAARNGPVNPRNGHERFGV